MTLWADFSLEGFKDSFQGGARAYLFDMAPPIGLPTLLLALFPTTPQYHVKAASLPGTDIEEITTNYMGAEARWAGSRRFSDWTVTYNMDIDGDLRKFFEAWVSVIHDPILTGAYGSPSYLGGLLSGDFNGVPYLSTLVFNQLDGEGEPVLTFTLMNAWPKNIGPATMDYSSQDVTQFDVTFSYLYYDCIASSFISSLIPGI
jgi:hypothetical protein